MPDKFIELSHVAQVLPPRKPIGRPLPVSAKTIVAMLCRRVPLIVTLFLAIVLVVGLLTALVPAKYESHMKVFVKNERADLVVSPDARSETQALGEVSETQINSEIELLTSNDLLSRVVRNCRLYQQPPGKAPMQKQPRPEVFEGAVLKLQHDLKITPVRKSTIIQISYAAAQPELAAAVLSELSKAYLDAHLSVHRTAGTQEFFKNQTARYEAQLREAERRLSNFRLQNNLTSITEQKDLMLRKFMDSETALREIDASLAEAGRRLGELHKQVGTQDHRIITQSRVIPNQFLVEHLNTMITELENRHTQALMKFQPQDRVVGELEEEIATTRASLERAMKLNSVEQSSDVNPLRQHLEAEQSSTELQQSGLTARRSVLLHSLDAYRANLAKLEDSGTEHDNLQRNVKELEESYLLYTRKAEEARIADSLDQQKIANVVIAERPVAYRLATKANLPLSMAIALLVGGIVSLGAALGLEYSASIFHTPAELEAAAGVPVLSTVPYENALSKA